MARLLLSPTSLPILKKLGLYYLLPITAVAILGFIHIHDPFSGDTALFCIGAKSIAEGKTLYVAFWDNKQPGVFLYYLLAGELFSFSEEGIHLFELLVSLLFGFLLIVLLKKYFENRWLASLVPISTVGGYYYIAREGTLTQPEMLVAFPIFVSICLFAKLGSSSKSRLILSFLSGIFAGFAVNIKLMFALIFPFVWIVTMFLFLCWKEEKLSEFIPGRLLPAMGGVFFVLLITVIWFWKNDAIGELYWVSIIYPLKAVREIERQSFSQLLTSTMWFVFYYCGWLSLTCLALVRLRDRSREILTYLIFLWISVGSVIILLQKLSWWHYHFLLLITPTGILAIRGLDVLLKSYNNKMWFSFLPKKLLIVFLIIFAFCPGFWRWQQHLKIYAKHWPIGGPEKILKYKFAKSENYENIWHDTRFLLDPNADQGPIYVFGNPLYMYLSEREYAIPMHGWAWEGFLRRHWDALPFQLSRASPPYIFLVNYYSTLLKSRSPVTKEWIDANYEILKENFEGIWYRRKKSS